MCFFLCIAHLCNGSFTYKWWRTFRPIYLSLKIVRLGPECVAGRISNIVKQSRKGDLSRFSHLNTLANHNSTRTCTSGLCSWVLNDGATKAWRPRANTPHYKEWLEEIGFEDVLKKRFFRPTSSWAKRKYYKSIGAFFQQDLNKCLEGICLKALRALDWTTKEIMTPCTCEERLAWYQMWVLWTFKRVWYCPEFQICGSRKIAETGFMKREPR